ncbi:hypothetical protein AKO1_001072 [Acrasis kona]|uniref:peptidylprolyl isomerase n=1 Tax=Acrasis kona TaxID=1008807 RepID=A0AAW2ZD30_9EUKA
MKRRLEDAPSDDDEDYGPQIPAPTNETADDDDYGPSIPTDSGVDQTKTTDKLKSKKRKTLEFAELYLEHLPSAAMYEWSYMHRDQLTHVLATPHTNFVITGSKDGVIKFWKRNINNVEFVKTFLAFSGKSPITSLCCSPDGLLVCSGSRYDGTFDEMNSSTSTEEGAIIKKKFVPSLLQFVTQQQGSAKKSLLMISNDSDASDPHYPVEFRLFDPRDAEVNPEKPIHTHKGHFHKSQGSRVLHMKYNEAHSLMVTCDRNGMIEYWNPFTGKAPAPNQLKFKFKTQTDLYTFCESNTYPMSLDFNKDGSMFACMGRDSIVRVFHFLTGKLKKAYNETMERSNQLQRGADPQYILENIDFGRRMAVEKEIEKHFETDFYGEQVSRPNCVFDESGHFLIYSTMLGIKTINMSTNRVERLLGKVENTERFLSVCLCQQPVKLSRTQLAKMNSGQPPQSSNLLDPTIYLSAYKKNRFYSFSRREPNEDAEQSGLTNGQFGRDVFNEKPSKEDVEMASLGGNVGKTSAEPSTNSQRANKATIHTTLGDIHVRLFPEAAPKAVYNFTQLSKEGYYNKVIFHRVIKNFMIQTGDPQGDGTGGASVWGHEFEDECVPYLRHDKAGRLSMANAGPNTNGSQFFITTVNTNWLDGKHTIFGEVIRGMDIVHTIESVEIDLKDKPEKDIEIINIDVEF